MLHAIDTDAVRNIIVNGQLKDLKSLLYLCKIDKSWHEIDTGLTLLHLAAMSDRVEFLDFLLGECKVNINVQDRDGNTALHLAVLHGHLEAMVTLFNYTPDDSILNKDLDPPLHVAIKQGAAGIRIVSEFIKHPAVDLFVKGRQGYTSCHVIAESNNVDALKLIHGEYLARNQSQNRSINRKFLLEDKNGLTAVHLAARSGSCKVLFYMLSRGGDSLVSDTSQSQLCRSPLHYAVECGRIECVKVLLEHGADPVLASAHYSAPIHLACSHGKLEIVKLMVDTCGKSILQSRDGNGRTTLHRSTHAVHCKDLITYLVDNGVNVDGLDPIGLDLIGVSPLSAAVQSGNIDAVEELLRLGGDLLFRDKGGFTMLHRAVLSEKIEVFRMIALTDTASAMAKMADDEGHYPIHYALKKGIHAMVVALLALNPEVVADKDRNNYIHLAATFSDVHIVSHLLGMPFAHSMLNETNTFGCTPLHCAAGRSSPCFVKILLNHGAVVHRNSSGQTPFMCACSNGNLSVVKHLYCGSEYQKDWVDHTGNTALHMAVDGKNADVITFCLDAGMAVSTNTDQLGFFDLILSRKCQTLARAVLTHRRWEECLDSCSSNQPHPILRILDNMPDMYQIILDQCHTSSSLDTTHRDYWEEFNFKCLNTTLPRQRASRPQRDFEVIKFDAADSGLVTEVGSSTKIRHFCCRARRNCGSLTVIERLIKHRHISYAQHPVVTAYIKLRWMGIGWLLKWTVWLAPIFLAVLFSLQFVLTDIAPSQNSTSVMNESDSSPSTPVAVVSILSLANLILSMANLLLVILEIYAHGLSLLFKFTLSAQVWCQLNASLSTFIFTLGYSLAGENSPNIVWIAAAAGVLSSWFSVGLNLQLVHFLKVGVYITMVISTARLMLIVLGTLVTFFLGFALSLNILVGTATSLQFDTVGRSYFSTFLSLIAVIDIEEFIALEQTGRLRFNIAVFIVLILLVMFFPILFINLLIALTVGDINDIQQEAVITRLAIETHAITSLDIRCLPRRCSVDVNTKRWRVYPNKVTCVSVVTKFLNQWLGGVSNEDKDRNENDGDFKFALEGKFAEFKKFQEQCFDKLFQRIDHLSLVEAEHFNCSEDKINKLDGFLEAKIKDLEDKLDKRARHTCKII